MPQKFDLDAMLASGELTQEQYDAHMKRRGRAASTKTTGSSGKVAVGNGSKVKRVNLTEDVLVGWYSELTMLQAQVADGKIEDGALGDALKALADGILHNVNPLKVRLPEIEQALSDAEIAVAEAQLAYAKADAEHVKARRSYGVESKEAKAAGDAAKAASDVLDKATATRNEAKKEYFLASR